MSAQSHKFLLYTAKVCPYAARVELALALAGIPYERFEVDLANKPSWYAERVNKASKVPVLVTDPEGTTEFKLPESLVIVEYIDELTSHSIFQTTDARFKATSRYIVERYAQLVQPHFMAVVLKRDTSLLPALREGLVEFNSLLAAHDAVGKTGPFIQGADRFGYADLCVVPFVARLLSASKHNLLPKADNEPEDAKGIYAEVSEGAPGLERIKKWWDAIQGIQAWNSVWDEETFLEASRRRLAKLDRTTSSN